MDFVTWMGIEMGKAHYQQGALSSNTLCDIISYTNPKSKRFTTVYIKQRVDTQFLSNLFAALPGNILIIVDSSLVTDKSVQEQWLKAVHALYYGRIYVWDTTGILPLHVNRQTGLIECGAEIQIGIIRCSMVDCLYKGFPGKFNIAMFNDPVFWAKGQQQKPPPREKKVPEDEQFWRDYAKTQPPHGNPNYSQKQNDFDYDAFRRAYEGYKQAYGASEQEYSAPYTKPRAPKGDRWFNAMMQGGSLEEAKRVYRKLGLEHHPDHNKSPDATETMKAINQAYEQVKRYFA